MELEIVILDSRDPVEGDVEQAVQDEPDNVQSDKVKVEADHALPPPVLVDLRVEGDGPENVQQSNFGISTCVWTLLSFNLQIGAQIRTDSPISHLLPILNTSKRKIEII